jgi:hypothetical protein
LNKNTELTNEEFELADEGKSYVEVDNDLRLLMSPRNWQLQKKLVAQSDTKAQKKGDVNWVSFKYYVTLNSALKDLIHIKMSKEVFNSAETMLKAHEKVINDIKQVFYPEYKIERVEKV